MYAEIIVDIAAEAVDRVFTYAVPDTLSLVPGMRVKVPFGPREKEGFVIRLKETADYDEKNYFDIEKFLDHKLELKDDDEYEVIDVTE